MKSSYGSVLLFLNILAIFKNTLILQLKSNTDLKKLFSNEFEQQKEKSEL